MKKSLFFISTIMIVAGLFGAGQAHATLLQIGFNGSISNAGSFLDPTGLFAQGDSITGFWEFETTTADFDSLDDTRGFYPQSGFPAFQINIGSSVFESNSMYIQIFDNYVAGIGTLDAYDVLATAETSNIEGLSQLNMQITLRDMQLPLDVFNNDSLPSTAPDPASFDQYGQVQGQISGYYNNSLLFMNLEITSTTIIDPINPVPEPATMLLFGTGIVGLVSARLRRKKK